jgi:hypothetical protein
VDSNCDSGSSYSPSTPLALLLSTVSAGVAATTTIWTTLNRIIAALQFKHLHYTHDDDFEHDSESFQVWDESMIPPQHKKTWNHCKQSGTSNNMKQLKMMVLKLRENT